MMITDKSYRVPPPLISRPSSVLTIEPPNGSSHQSKRISRSPSQLTFGTPPVSKRFSNPTEFRPNYKLMPQPNQTRHGSFPSRHRIEPNKYGLFDQPMALHAPTRHLSLTPQNLRNSHRYSIDSVSTDLDSIFDNSPSPPSSIDRNLNGFSPSSLSRSLPSRPSLLPRSAVVNYFNLDFSFLDDEPPPPEPEPERAPIRSHPIFPSANNYYRITADKGRISSTGRGELEERQRVSMLSVGSRSDSLDSLQEETKAILKLVPPCELILSFSELWD